MLTKPFKPLALAFLVNLIISVEDKIKYNKWVIGVLLPRPHAVYSQTLDLVASLPEVRDSLARAILNFFFFILDHTPQILQKLTNLFEITTD